MGLKIKEEVSLAMNEQLPLIATCPMGVESIVDRELKQLGYENRKTQNGRVLFYGNMQDIARCNLWLRSADRVLIKMGQYTSQTFDELFEGVKAIEWTQWIPPNGQFLVEGRSHKSVLSSVPACQSIVKKAIVEKLKQNYSVQWFPEDGPRFIIGISLLNDEATVTLDTTGMGLHKRGYRHHATKAPLKETLAAALIQLSRWNPTRPLYDPCCGSGTLLIEAAMIGWNIAPGIKRSFDAEHWPIFCSRLWDNAREEAFDSVNDNVSLEIRGSDIDAGAIDIAKKAIKHAGFEQTIRVDVMSVESVKPQGKYGCLIANPPYGERLSEKEDVEHVLYKLGVLTAQLDTWSTFILSATKSLEQIFNEKATKRRKLFNGRIECQYYQYLGPLPPRAHSKIK